jgi:long-chain acyl-CoA synthetase
VTAEAEFHFLKSSFRQNYLTAIEQFKDRPFVTVYPARGAPTYATFARFHENVRAAIRHLTRVTTNERVVVTVAGNSYEHLIYIVATLLTGRTLCPINRDEGADRIQSKIQALGEPCLTLLDLKSAKSLDVLSAHRMEADWDHGLKTSAAGETQSTSDLGIDFPKDRPMVLIFTSGSTGYSKIVEQTENGILTNVDALIERHGLNPASCIGTPLPVFHVNALEFSFFSSLFSGAVLVLWENVLLPRFFETLALEKCTILSIVPPILRSLVKHEAEFKRFTFPNLKYFVTAAAPLSHELACLAVEQLGVRVIQGYGLSEAVNFSCLMPVDLNDQDYQKWLTAYPWPSIGTPLRGTEVEILNEKNQLAGEGEVGEICIRGPTVMRGYRNDTDSGIVEQGLLHTGDLGVYHLDDSGGRFYFITGRKKEIVKRYGMTISMREIDDVLATFVEDSFDAIAVAFENEASGEEVGLLVSKSGEWDAKSESKLLHHIESHLPLHLRPHVVFKTKRALRTPSGKPCRYPFQPLFERFRTLTIGNSIRFFDDPA